MSDPLDVITLEDAAAALGISDAASQATKLPRFITAVSRRLDAPDLLGPILVRTITSELHDGSVDDGQPLTAYTTPYLDPLLQSRRSTIKLRHPPISSITTFTEYAGTTGTVLTAETNATKTATNYQLYAREGRVMRRANGAASYFPAGLQNLEVTYQAGRFATLDDVDDRYQLAALFLVDILWRSDQGGGTQTYGDTPTSGLPFTSAALSRVRDMAGDELPIPTVA